LGVVPLDPDVIELECTNHVVGSTYACDFHVKVQTLEPLSPSSQVLAIVHPALTFP